MNTYTESRVRQAFWDMFHKSGEQWFDYLGSEEECNESTEDHWQDFLKHLRDQA